MLVVRKRIIFVRENFLNGLLTNHYKIKTNLEKLPVACQWFVTKDNSKVYKQSGHKWATRQGSVGPKFPSKLE